MGQIFGGRFPIVWSTNSSPTSFHFQTVFLYCPTYQFVLKEATEEDSKFSWSAARQDCKQVGTQIPVFYDEKMLTDFLHTVAGFSCVLVIDNMSDNVAKMLISQTKKKSTQVTVHYIQFWSNKFSTNAGFFFYLNPNFSPGCGLMVHLWPSNTLKAKPSKYL